MFCSINIYCLTGKKVQIKSESVPPLFPCP